MDSIDEIIVGKLPSTMSEPDNTEHSSFNITIKDEPIDEYASTMGEITVIKDELEDIYGISEGFFNTMNFDNVDKHPNDSDSSSVTYSPNASSVREKDISACKKDAAVTRKIIINGKEKTCVLVKMPQLNKSNIANSIGNPHENSSKTVSPGTNTTNKLKVQCPRCKEKIDINAFRKHIDLCPPRKCGLNYQKELSLGNECFSESQQNKNKTGGVSTPDSLTKLLTNTKNIAPTTVYNRKELTVVERTKNHTVTKNADGENSHTQYLKETMMKRINSTSESSNHDQFIDAYYSDVLRPTANLDQHQQIEAEKRHVLTESTTLTVELETKSSGENNEPKIFSPRRTRSKSCSIELPKPRRKSVNIGILDFDSNKYKTKYSEDMETRAHSRRTRSKSVCREKLNVGDAENSVKDKDGGNATEDFISPDVENQNGNNETPEKQDKNDHAQQMAYYQRFLEIRSRSVNSKLGLCTKTPNSNVSENVNLSDSTSDDNCDNVAMSNQDSNIAQETEGILDHSLLFEDNTYSCSLCSFTTDKQKTLQDHERNHRRHNKPIFQCAYCNQKYTRYALYLHIQYVHPGQKFEIAEEKHSEKTHTDDPKPVDTHTEEKDTQKLAENKNIPKYSCTRCSYTSNNCKSDIIRHQRLHDKNVPILQCNRCDFRSTPMALKSHKCAKNQRARNIDSTFRYKCNKCSYSCQHKSKFSMHRGSHANKRPIRPCPYNCSYESTPAALNAHAKKCSKNKAKPANALMSGELPNPIAIKTKFETFKCPKCPFSTGLRIKLNFHNKKEHSKLQNLPHALLKCSSCSHTTINQEELDQHMKCHESHMPTLKCGNCDYTDTMFALRRHFFKTGHWLENEKASETKPLESIPGPLNSNNLNTADKDEERGPDAMPLKIKQTQFKCPKCQFSTDLRIKLKIHLNQHDPKFLQCLQCSFGTTRIGNYRQHVRSHENLPTKLCHCGFKSTPVHFMKHISRCVLHNAKQNAKSLNIAAVSDSKLNVFQCKLCSVISTNQYTFKRHRRSHRRNQPIEKCPHCSFRSTANCLYRHLKQHERQQASKHELSSTAGETVLESKMSSTVIRCRKCSFVCVTNLSMAAHIRVHKKNQSVKKCPCCSFKSTPRCLRYHMDKFNHKRTKQPIINLREDIKMSKTIYPKENTSRKSCGQCSFIATRQYTLNVHMRSHKMNRPIKKCSRCSFKSTPKCLYVHMKRFNHSSVIQPETAPKTDKNPETTSIVYNCSLCSYVSLTQQGYAGHMRAHQQNMPVKKCPCCSFKSTPGCLIRHMNEFNHKKAIVPTTGLKDTLLMPQNAHPNNNFVYKCGQCSFVGTKQHYFKRHMRAHKRNQPIKKCPCCNFKSTPKCLYRHMCALKHTNPKKSRTDRYMVTQKSSAVFPCSECSFVSSQKNFGRHIRAHKQNQPVTKCPCCSFRSTPRCLYSHMHKYNHNELKQPITEKEDIKLPQNVQPQKSSTGLKCGKCSYVGKSKYTFVTHMRTHEMKQPVKQCPRCSFKSTPNCLYRHMAKLNHRSPIKPVTDSKSDIETPSENKTLNAFKCSQCSYIGTTPQGFFNHSHSHKKNQPVIKCPCCSFKSTPDCLSRHMKEFNHKKTVTEKLLKCQLCSANFKSQSIKKHMKAHAAGQPIKQCKFCKFKSTPRHLKNHIQVHYGSKSLRVLGKKKPGSLIAFNQSSKPNSCSTVDSSTKNSSERMLISAPRILGKEIGEQQHLDRARPDHSVIEEDMNVGSLQFNEAVPKDDQVDTLQIVGDINQSPKFNCPFCTFATCLRIKLNVHKRKMHSELSEATNNTAGGVRDEHNSGPDVKSQKLTVSILNAPNQNKQALDLESTTKQDETKELAFSCTICSYTSNSELNWKKHVNSHKRYNLPIYQCQYCQFKGTLNKVNAHSPCCVIPEGTHKKSPKKISLNCAKCSFTTYFPAELQSHEERDHVENKVIKNLGLIKNFKCEYCSFNTYWQYLMERHMHSHTILKLPINHCSKCDFHSTPAALAAHTNKCIKGPGRPTSTSPSSKN